LDGSTVNRTFKPATDNDAAGPDITLSDTGPADHHIAIGLN
jgi:hypothetical protein